MNNEDERSASRSLCTSLILELSPRTLRKLHKKLAANALDAAQNNRPHTAATYAKETALLEKICGNMGINL